MKTESRIFFPTEASKKFSSVIPVECPYCGAYNLPQITHQSTFSSGNLKIWTLEFSHCCCDKQSIGVYKVHKTDGEFLGMFPPAHKLPDLPSSICTISPRFVKLYSQSSEAEQNGHLELSGSGYRNAIEILIKDFAIKELSYSEEEVCKKSLSQAIEAYLPDIDLSVSADVIRVLGNDYTHYERKYEEVDFVILKRYINIFIDSIDCKYLINHPPVPINSTLRKEE